MNERNTVIRNMIADFLNIGTTLIPEWSLMGIGFNTLNENPQSQIDTKAYISDKSATSIIKGYQTQFPFDTDLIESEQAVMALYDVGRNQKQGAQAEYDYVRVELFKTTNIPDVHPARFFRVAIEVSNVTGAGAEVIHVTGNLNGVGDFVDGTFDVTTKIFTPGAPTQIPRLATPTGLSISGTVLTWNPVINVESYIILKDGLYFDESQTEFLSLANLITPGTFQLTVIAAGDGITYNDSLQSSPIPYTVATASTTVQNGVGETVQVVTSPTQLEYVIGVISTGGDLGKITKGTTGRAVTNLMALAVTGGNIISTTSAAPVGQTFALAEFASAPLQSSTLASGGEFGGSWINTGTKTLQLSTRYVYIAFRNGNGSVGDFTSTELSDMNTWISVV